MRFIGKYIGGLYFNLRFYLVAGLCIMLFVVSFFVPGMFDAIKILLLVFIALVVVDYVFLFMLSKAPTAKRLTADRLSNGDVNKIEIQVKNNMLFTVDMEIIDELPVQFQKRDWKLNHRFKAKEQKNILYNLRPVERGEYHFGRIIVYVKGIILRQEKPLRFIHHTCRCVNTNCCLKHLSKPNTATSECVRLVTAWSLSR